MSKIISGVLSFKDEVHNKKKALFEELSRGQSPEALFITCSDSRIDPNLMVQTEPGELFIIRNAGNMVPPYETKHTGGVTASIEYAVSALNVKHIVICGHSGCGAMQGALNPDLVKELPHVSHWLSFAKDAKNRVEHDFPDADHEELLNRLVEQNVVTQMEHIKTHPLVAEKLASGAVTLHGWCYDIGSGDVSSYDEDHGEFLPVQEKYKQVVHRALHKNSTCC